MMSDCDGPRLIILPNAEQMWIAQSPDTRKLLDTELTGADGVTVTVESDFGLYGLPLRDVPLQEPKVYTDVAEQVPVTLNFDYRHKNTDGIAFDKNGVPWVIQISPNGVMGVKLHMDAVSLTVEGREQYLAVSPELTEFFDEFGGFPLGVAIPYGSKLDSWKRAGEITTLLDADGILEFFDGKSAYASDMGWCFNSRGTEAHNTCHSMSSEGISVGYHYAINILLDSEREFLDTEAGLILSGMAAGKGFALVNKGRRMNQSNALSVLKVFDNDGDKAGWEAYDKVIITSALNGSAKLSLLRSGKLYHNGSKHSGTTDAYGWSEQPQIKFPDSMLGGLRAVALGHHSG